MARLSSVTSPSVVPDPTAINLTRLLARLDATLYSHDADTQSKLRKSSIERERVSKNLKYGRGLLLKLEEDALDIKTQATKQLTQTELVHKREQLADLTERLEALNELADPDFEEDGSSEGEDLLGVDTPSEETDEQTSETQPTPPRQPEPLPPSQEPEPSIPAPTTTFQTAIPPPPPQEPEPEPEFTATLRSRQNPRTELFSKPATSTGLSTSTTETLLTHNRTEQESLTNSLLNMASALKESSRAFASTLESEKSTLDRAAEGLDQNELGLEAASRRMGYLRSISEGKGWWGRMLLYAYIAGLMVVAILLVFVMPKFRFN